MEQGTRQTDARNCAGEKITSYHWRGIGGIQGNETGRDSARNRRGRFQTGHSYFRRCGSYDGLAIHCAAIAHGRITKYVLSEAADGPFSIEAAAPVHRLDSPMENLVRRKDHEGRPFLERDLIKAGLRLHEEFRLTGCEDQIETYLDDLLCQRRDYDLSETPAGQRTLEQFRVKLEDLGPGLTEVAVRC